ncbi:hypothetical protein [Aquisalinus flavus]|uniref:Glycine zipper 2TM domain-containing protein n=1 Tax=Aquisalinus flavus TaxID=1526572 RepID=A0A8J2Y4L0_9PROT|nr:hypothetical protein [Aquisalinus flavus]MBD0426842.1 hypothetical protein [Aquisalinus flavus]UNE46689.1 hypothetical protein FF099_00760 [Aquisalinus flavus]GGC96422.1 hypothetical protein GCM10011342_01550 [Aquisalinus flavus]
MRITPILFAAPALLLLNGCLAGAAINAVGETVEAGVEVTGAVIGTTAKTGGAVVGGTVDAIMPGDQSGKKDKKKKDRD